MSITLPKTVQPVLTNYSDLPQPAAAVHDKLIPPYNVTINIDGKTTFSVAIIKDNPAPTTVEFIASDAAQGGDNILKVTCSYQANAPGTQVDVYTYTIDLGMSIPLKASVFPLSYATHPNDKGETNEGPETSRGTVVIVKGGHGDPIEN